MSDSSDSSVDYAPPYVEEDLQILEESVRPPTTLSADSFMRPIDDLCTRRPLITAKSSARIADAIQLMQEHRIGAVPIVDDGKLVGIVTERDMMMKVLGSKLDPASTPVTRIMTRDPQTLMRQDAIAYLLNAMRVGGFRHVPIIDESGRPTNLISLRDVLAYIVDNFPAEVINIPSEPFRGTPSQYGG